MDAIILVGGQGTRLRPLTATRHKSLVPVCNRPVIGYLFDWIERSGFERAILALGQFNEDLAAAFPPGRYGKLEIVAVQEKERLESGGAIRNAVRTAGVQGRFAVLNGDIFVDFDFAPTLTAHSGREADLTLALYDVPDPSSFGVAVVDAEGVVTGFVEKPPRGTAPSSLVNAGVWIFEPGLVDEIPPGAVRVEETLFPSLVARRRRVLGYQFRGIWADIGTPARYLALNTSLAGLHGPAIARDARVDPGATVKASAIGAATSIGAGAHVENAILWENVGLGPGAFVREAILADGVHVGAGARIEGAVIGSSAMIPEGATVPPGTCLDPGERYHAADG